jgi:hypothetical protein
MAHVRTDFTLREVLRVGFPFYNPGDDTGKLSGENAFNAPFKAAKSLSPPWRGLAFID